MKKISPAVEKYVLNDFVWKADLPAFLKEVCECTNNGAYAITFNLIYNILTILTQRAIELNDPALNIIMINLGLYEGSHSPEMKAARDKEREKIRKAISTK